MTIKEFRIKLQMLALTCESEEDNDKQLYQLSANPLGQFESLIYDMQDAGLIKERY